MPQLRDVNVSADHRCIVWCFQAVKHVSAALLDAAAGDGTQRSAAGTAHRRNVFQRRFGAAAQERRAKPSWRIVSAALAALPALPAMCSAQLVMAAQVR